MEVVINFSWGIGKGWERDRVGVKFGVRRLDCYGYGREDYV